MESRGRQVPEGLMQRPCSHILLLLWRIRKCLSKDSNTIWLLIMTKRHFCHCCSCKKIYCQRFERFILHNQKLDEEQGKSEGCASLNGMNQGVSQGEVQSTVIPSKTVQREFVILHFNSRLSDINTISILSNIWVLGYTCF